MSRSVTLELPDEVFDAVTRAAEATGKSPSDWIVLDLDRRFGNSQEIQIATPKVPKELREVLMQKAARLGRPVEDVIREWWFEHEARARPTLTPEESREAWERLIRHVGAVDLGHPTGADNESIDADLAREYGGAHEEKSI